MRKPKLVVAALAVALAGGVAAVAIPAAAAPAPPALSGKTTEYTVLASQGASVADVTAVVEKAGGKVVRSNKAVGLLTVKAPENGFTARVGKSEKIFGTSKARVIGHAPRGADNVAKRAKVEKEHTFNTDAAGQSTERKSKQGSREVTMDPLDEQLWGLKMVRSDLAREVQPGKKKVTVGVIDTGIDGNHPDIKPNFDKKLSRNFTVDIPTDPNGEEIDGPCEYRGCVDPVDVDNGGHGTHVAGTIAAAANDFGISGVAPNVTLVNIRAGQDYGFFFLQPTVDALTYAGDKGIDVVNMSFYVDPWLYNCDANPADSAAEQQQQRTIKEAMKRAMRYANSKGVTQITALGNEHEDSGKPLPDASSPDYPLNQEKTREIDNKTCLDLPTEGPHALGVAALGPSKKKSDFSTYGLEQISVSAPGGYFRDYVGTPDFMTNENLILSAYPKNVGITEGNIAEDGTITEQGKEAGVQRAKTWDGQYGYYQFLQGTSMAAPHASGVSALIVSQYGEGSGGGYGLAPATVKKVLEGTAIATPCPKPRTVDYLEEGRDETWTATCRGGWEFNGFYGHGVIDAFGAVKHGGGFAG